MNVKNLRKISILLTIAALSLALLLSGCASSYSSGEPGSWLPDIGAEDINRFVAEGARGVLQYEEEEKIEVMLEYLTSFPHETVESAEPPEDAESMKIRIKDGTTFEFYFDEYGVYVDGTAYMSSEPYFGMLAAQVSTEWNGLEELPSMETSPFSEVFAPVASEVEWIDMLAVNGGRMSFSTADGISGALDYIGKFPYYYRLPLFDEPEMIGSTSPYILLKMKNEESERLELIVDSVIIYNEICYVGPAYFSDMKDALGEYSD